MAESSRGIAIATWVVCGLLAALYLFAGAGKLFIAPADAAETFVRYGFTAGIATFIGACELAGGVGLLIPALSGLAAACLIPIMLGAIYSHLSHDPPQQALGAVVALVLLIWVVYARGVRLPGRG